MDMDASYYRLQAKLAKRLSQESSKPDVQRELAVIARDFAQIAQALENGAIEIRHPELMPRR
jgi:hypothetical protein